MAVNYEADDALLQCPLDGLFLEALDDVALAQVVVIRKRHSTFLAGRYLFDIVLEALEDR